MWRCLPFDAIIAQLASSRAEEEMADRQAQEGRERAEGLERELRDTRREAAALKGQLAATEEVIVHNSYVAILHTLLINHM